jgi:hypothetical protein
MLFPKEIFDIILCYAADMSLLELSPMPGRFTGCITPLNFQVSLGYSSLSELILLHIVDAVDESNPNTLTTLFLQSRIAEVIEFPLLVVNAFERAIKIWHQRQELYQLPPTLPPLWNTTLPFLLLEYMRNPDVDVLYDRINLWLGDGYNISLMRNPPFVRFHTVL